MQTADYHSVWIGWSVGWRGWSTDASVSLSASTTAAGIGQLGGLPVGRVYEFLSNGYGCRLAIHGGDARSAQQVGSLLAIQGADEQLSLASTYYTSTSKINQGLDPGTNSNRMRKSWRRVGENLVAARIIGKGDGGVAAGA